MSTNICPEHISTFEALTSAEHDNYALFSCFANGAPVAAIVVVTPPEDGDGEYQITPLFVSVSETIVLTDHDGAAA